MITFRALNKDEIEVRVGQCSDKGCSLLLYKTARVDMALLDEVVGPENWQCDYKSIDGKLFCGIGILTDNGWVWKWDTGTESNMEAQKGEASDAYKRAGFKVGIGRELYTAPFIWVPSDKCKLKQGRNGKLQCYDRFSVGKLEVKDGKIAELVVRNGSTKGNPVVFRYPPDVPKPDKRAEEAPKALPDDQATLEAKKRLWKALQRYAELHGRTPEDLLKGVKKRPEWAETADFFNMVAAEFEAECHV